jgi:hypothetical protein
MNDKLNHYYEKQYPYRISQRALQKVSQHENGYLARAFFTITLIILLIILWAHMVFMDELSFMAPKDSELLNLLHTIADDDLSIVQRFKAVYETALYLLVCFKKLLGF